MHGAEIAEGAAGVDSDEEDGSGHESEIIVDIRDGSNEEALRS